jgi:outer membrane protein
MNASIKWFLLLMVALAAALGISARGAERNARPALSRYPLEQQLQQSFARQQTDPADPVASKPAAPRVVDERNVRPALSRYPLEQQSQQSFARQHTDPADPVAAKPTAPRVQDHSSATCRRLPPVATSPQLTTSSMRHAAHDPATDGASSVDEDVDARSLLGQEVIPLSVETLVGMSLTNSPRVQVLRLQPLIEQQRIGEAEGRFDWAVFLRNRWLDTSRPAGSELDVGVPQARLVERNLQTDGGLRRVNAYGGQLEAAQALNGMDSNSQFIAPAQQALTNLTLRYSQPLLRDRGTLVNQGQIIIARHQGDAASAVSRGELADHTLAVVEAYWDIYRLRAHVASQKRLCEATQSLLERLRRRQQIDASRVILIQAESTALSRDAALVGVRGELRRAQNHLIKLVGPTTWDSSVELLPTESPYLEPLEVSLDHVLASAVENRPEVIASLEKIRAAEISKTIHENQLLPQLALVLENSLYGLRGDYDLARSWADQFSRGRPTYSAALNFEYSLSNQTARARLRRAQLQAARDVAAMAEVVQQVRLEVMNAVLELEIAHEQLHIRRTAKELCALELESMERRRLLFPEADRIATLTLQELLDSQQRLALAEREYADSEAACAVAILRLRRAEGTLWQSAQSTHQADSIVPP